MFKRFYRYNTVMKKFNFAVSYSISINIIYLDYAIDHPVITVGILIIGNILGFYYTGSD